MGAALAARLGAMSDRERRGSAWEGFTHVRAKRASAWGAAAVLVGSLFFPWWISGGALRDITPELRGWGMLATGLGFGDAAASTGFSGFGNVIFGAIPAGAVLVLAALLMLRALRPRLAPAGPMVAWSVLAILPLVLLLGIGLLRRDDYNGVYPVTWGVLVALMAAVFTLVTMIGWWSKGERERLGTDAVDDEVPDEDASVPDK